MLLSDFIRKKKKLIPFKKAHVEDLKLHNIDMLPRNITDDYINNEIRELSSAFVFEDTKDEEMWNLLNFEFKSINEK